MIPKTPQAMVTTMGGDCHVAALLSNVLYSTTTQHRSPWKACSMQLVATWVLS